MIEINEHESLIGGCTKQPPCHMSARRSPHHASLNTNLLSSSVLREICHLTSVNPSRKLWSWLTSNKPQGQSLRAASIHSIDGRSRWLVGSSIRMTFGCCNMILPNIKRRCSPPDTTLTDFSLSSFENSMRPSVPRRNCSSAPLGCHWVIHCLELACYMSCCCMFFFFFNVLASFSISFFFFF